MPAETDLTRRTASWPSIWVRAVRVHQWAKNSLLLLPALAAHLGPSEATLGRLIAGFFSFSLLASAVYLVNDILDVENDRAHPIKRTRPIAAGEVPIAAAAVGAALLAAAAFGLAWSLPRDFKQVWAFYLAVTTLYSFALKRVVVLDVMVLGGLYTLRVMAGAAAVEVPLSRWFLAFAVFLFSSLALLKRMVESIGVEAREGETLAGRGWTVRDIPVLLGFGTACSVASALVYCLYITGDEVSRLYTRPDALWLGLPVLLYWLGRVWLLAWRGEVHEDPIVFALHDRASYGVAAAMALTLWLAA